MDKTLIILPNQIKPELLRELGPEVIFHEALLDEAVKIAEEYERAGGIGVIISRGGSADAIRNAVKITVVNCEVSAADLINTLLDIKKQLLPHQRTVAVINYGNVAYDVSLIRRLLDIEVKQFWYWTDANEVRERVKQVKDEGIEVVLGASLTVASAEEFGIKGYRVHVGLETLRQAMDKAKEILEIRRNDLVQAERIRSILNFAREGIVSVDLNNKIDFSNPRAENILSYGRHALVGEEIGSVIPGWDGRNNDLRLDQVTGVGRRQIVYNRIPVIVHDQVVGSVVTFTESADVVKTEERIRVLTHAHGHISKYRLAHIVGESAEIRETVRKAEIYGKTESSVLITGETGTGKELFAHGIHHTSPRRASPFVAINCSAIPESLLESELFGYAEGAFTGARKGGRMGLFEIAHRGTIFLDEISEIPLTLQTRLLRVLQEKEVMRIGGDRVIPVDVRIIAATNKDLAAAVERGEFRRDLFYRINTLQLKVPPLRKRLQDIPLLIEHFMRNQKGGYSRNVPMMAGQLMDRMMNHTWPGNVRELEQLIQRYFLLVEHIDEQELLEELFGNYSQNESVSAGSSDHNILTVKMGPLSKMIDDLYSAIYARTGGNKSKTADILGVNRMTVAKWLRHQETLSGRETE